MTESHATLVAEVARLRQALREIVEHESYGAELWAIESGLGASEWESCLSKSGAIARRALRGE